VLSGLRLPRFSSFSTGEVEGQADSVSLERSIIGGCLPYGFRQLPLFARAELAKEFYLKAPHFLVLEGPSGFDPTISAGGRSTTIEAVVTLQVTLTDRATGAVIFTRASSEFRKIYEISGDTKAYFDESGTAMDRLSRDVARSVVSGQKSFSISGQ